jgi:hypothetical protein
MSAIFEPHFESRLYAEVLNSFERMGSPHVLMRPRLTVDGGQYCALYGENLADGVAGFGATPAEAMADFDRNWYHQRAQA